MRLKCIHLSYLFLIWFNATDVSLTVSAVFKTLYMCFGGTSANNR